MLDFTDFKTALVAGCRSMLDAIPEDSILKNIELEERSVTKAQRGELSALLFRVPGTACAPTFYVEDFYGMYRDGHPLEELYVRLVQDGIHYVTNPPSIAGIDPEALAEREGFGVRLLNKAKNHDYLKDVPHIDDIGLALIAEMRSGEFRAVITNSLMEEMGLTKEELFEKALRESAEKDRATLYRISDMLCSPESCENLLESGADAINESDPLLVLSNEDCFWGASALFYPGMKVRDILKLSADLRKKDCSAEAKDLCGRLQLDPSRNGCILIRFQRFHDPAADALPLPCFLCYNRLRKNFG